MKTHSFLTGALAAALLLMTAPLTRLSAVIPEPDNILYGSIVINNTPASAASTNLVIEARRTTNGPAIASYRMGSDPEAGDLYALRLKLESISPKQDDLASVSGDSLWIVLRDGTATRAQTNITVRQRGFVQRLDFGSSVLDGDGDRIPDAWELAWFGSLTNNASTVTLNGQTVLQNFVAGTNPNDPDGAFRLRIALTNNNLKRVWFTARKAEGPGYEGMVRRYTLEFRPSLAQGFWADVPNYVNLAGTNQTVDFFSPGSDLHGFFRARISLDNFIPPGTEPGEADSDADGLPDAWETTWFGSLARTADFIAPNQVTALQNYIAGTDPNTVGSQHRLMISRNPLSNEQTVSFTTIAPQGPGYQGKTRRYALESSILPGGPFAAIPGYSNVLGTGQIATYPIPVSTPTLFYRTRVWLE